MDSIGYPKTSIFSYAFNEKTHFVLLFQFFRAEEGPGPIPCLSFTYLCSCFLVHHLCGFPSYAVVELPRTGS